MATFTAIVVGHGDGLQLNRALYGILGQSRPPDEILVYACCIPGADSDHPLVVVHRTEHRGDWGHHDRSVGVTYASGDYLGFFNSDDSYEHDFLEEMLGEAESSGADVVYCGWNTYPECEFRLGSSTSGNFIVRTELARRVGYPASRVYENDGHFIDALATATDRIEKVPLNLYHHNIQ